MVLEVAYGSWLYGQEFAIAAPVAGLLYLGLSPRQYVGHRCVAALCEIQPDGEFAFAGTVRKYM